jgi:hypothetical protein
VVAPPKATVPVGAPVVTARTVPVSSPLGGFLLPGVLMLGISGVVVSAFSRLVLRQRGVR